MLRTVTERYSRQIAWKKRNPWIRYLEYARRRCAETDNFPSYVGINCRLTGPEIKEIWKRDRAWKLKKPSLDRIDSKGHYEMGNVRFIEFKLNARMAWDKTIVPEFT